MSHTVLDPKDLRALQYIVTHVYFPLKLPTVDDHNIYNDYSLAGTIAAVARIYRDRIDNANRLQWHYISRMLDNLQATIQSECLDAPQTISQLNSMKAGDALAFLVRAQNAAVIFRKQSDVTIFESFEVSPRAEDVMATNGKLICSYPGPAIEVPNAAFEDQSFLSELVNFLVQMNSDVLEATPDSQEGRATVAETAHPRYITELLTGILRGVGSPANIVRITKRVGDDVIWDSSPKLPWRRSSLWLLIRVALQTSLDRHDYKEFMLFFLCRLGGLTRSEKTCAHFSNDLLQCMSAKISRRLRKLASAAPAWLSSIALETCHTLQSILEDRWERVLAAQRVSPAWTPSQLDLAQDSRLSLSSSGEYIQNTLSDCSIYPPDPPFNPQHRPRGTLDDFLFPGGFEDAYHAEPHVALYDVEWAVEQGIDAWIKEVEYKDEACEKLEILANKYSSSARRTYKNNPELLSVMLLTMIELWIALDKIAIKEIPMLAEYSPEVPTSLLEDLLLFKSGNLRRLRCAHQYISDRHSQSQSHRSVFSQKIDENSFSVRFYDDSDHLQFLKAKIENTAQKEVDEKVAELETENARYADLRQTADKTDHQYIVNRLGDEEHTGSCRKCAYEQSLRNMEIAIHEWPLPAEELHAQAVVFELDCPISFNMWRTATFRLLVDLCSPPIKPKYMQTQLSEYTALQPYFVQHPRSRITLVSDVAPLVETLGKKSIPMTRERVCVNNGLAFYSFDSGVRNPVLQALGRVNVRGCCTYKLPSGSYQNLQEYVDATFHTSNEIMANQADCPPDISIHEFVAFGHLRSGGVLQWLNILREFRGRSLSLRRPETHLLLAQAVSQVGPLTNTGWTWHEDIQQPSFCYALLGELESLLRDVEANWLEVVTMDTISLLLRRLLASVPDQDIVEKTLELLRAARGKVFSLVQELSAKLVNASGDQELHGFLRDAAAICRSTFDVDPSVVCLILHSAEDIEVLLSSAALIHDHTPSDVSCLPAYSQLLLDRDRRVSLALEGITRNIIQEDMSDEGINLAIDRIWPHYRPGSKWVPLQNPSSRWLSCITEQTDDQCSQEVHFNLLDGSLLVNGKPLGRLPNEILRHPIYNLIFGKKVLDVLPSDLPGMDYATRNMVSGYQVHFAPRNNGSDLVIRAISRSETIELIPQQKLKGDLPDVLIEGHAHWLNVSTCITEIRPLSSLWNSSSVNWMMNCTSGQYHVYRGRELLVDTRSKTWAMVSTLFEPLEIPQNLLITVSPNESEQPALSLQLFVSLPRYRLSFYVDEEGDLQSHDIRGMVYDRNQCVGTMFGLVNRLVLRPKLRGAANVDDLVRRCVIIPEGEVSFEMDGHHVSIKIKVVDAAEERVTYQIYEVETDVGCLIGNGSLTSKLYRAYLHALTSGCGNDPLTRRSGTEEALSLLRSAGCWSIMRLNSRDAVLLCLIASIYPMGANSLGWRNLPVNSQRHELLVVSRAIKEYCERVQLFHENWHTNDPFHDFPSSDSRLELRNARRAAYFFPLEFSQQPSGPGFDIPYPARDLVLAGSGEHRAYVAASIVRNRAATALTDVLSLVESWTGVVKRVATLSLRYDKSWLALDLPSTWLTTYDLLRGCSEEKWTQLLFTLPAMAYASSERAELVSVFVTFAADSRFRSEDPPNYNSYKTSDGYRPSSTSLRRYISDYARDFKESPEGRMRPKAGESPAGLRKRQRQMLKERLNSDTEATVEMWRNAWPCETPPQCSLDANAYYVEDLMAKVRSHFSSRYHNRKLKEHLLRVQDIFKTVHSHIFPTPTYSFDPSKNAPPCTPWLFTTDQLFARPTPKDAVKTGNTPFSSLGPPGPLHRLIATAETNALNSFQQQYVSALHASAKCFGSEMSPRGETELPTLEKLSAHYVQCRDNYIEAFRHLKHRLGPEGRNEQALWHSGQWPRITPQTLFRLLASNSPMVLSDEWKRCLIKFIHLALDLQRARRLLRLRLHNLHEELRKELQNKGCDGWNAESRPDWLLIQLQGDFLVRRVQADVANEMITPSSGTNTAMQLNMGEGKSSVIVPIIVVVLADGGQLIRVIVPKALTAQMFQLLVDRLGGLLNRRIYFIPFSRALKVSDDRVAVLSGIMSECMKERGILVVQPEHVLSLRLVSVEKQLPQAGGGRLARALLGLQRWLHSHSRDVLDESDEILHVRYQLVYTIGHQQDMEGSPGRWTTTQQVLGRVRRHAPSVRDRFPFGVEYEQGPPGSFPHFRILHADAGKELVSRIVQDVMDGRLPNFSLGQSRSDRKDAILSFISDADVPPEKFQLVKEYTQETSKWSDLLLLRGLLASGILLFAFRERRWRVDYGLAPKRTMLAVPYRAKDIPAERAEFGHPDVAIILTCLSYYYGGLSEEQLRISFDILLKQDDPSMDYDLWVQDCWPAVPENLRTISGINTKSPEQWKESLVPLFSQSRAVIDFYISIVVFPREAKEFLSKLSCSGWDLAEKKERLVTGFSGTNDGRYLLPLHITQRDPDHQRGTNAKVLSYLLQQENQYYMCMTNGNGERRTTREFLKILLVQKPEIRVLLDVGAQMLDLRNHKLAKVWLDVNQDASAAIYFNEYDELTVRTRDGGTQLLISSSFAQQLDQCVIYLDDAHTRGTDIKFPIGFRAAVTLGPKVTKDRLTQGCMRMRKLGHGHSIMFFAPLEIDRRIRSAAGKDKDGAIETADIIHWAVRETCDDIQQRAPHWAQQGIDHTSRYVAWGSFCNGQLSSEALSEKWLQPEAKRLEDLYGRRNSSSSGSLAVPGIRQRLIELDVPSLRDVSLDEEQEREVIHEAERERQVERPPKVQAASCSIHKDVTSFVMTGVVPTNTNAFYPAFETLNATSAAIDEAHIWSPHVLATADFQKTVSSQGNTGEYLRPVQWIVSGKRDGNEVLVILSPSEVNHLIPYIRSSNKVHLHVYTPRTIKSMEPCDDLTLYSIPAVPDGWTPPWPLMDQLNVFAGQLYLKDYETYIRLCRFLCVYARDLKDEDIDYGPDGFIPPTNRPSHLPVEHTFQKSPMGSLRTLMGLRRKGMRFSPTHMGKLIDGRPLFEEDFQDCDS